MGILGLGTGELIAIALILLLLFGAKKLPELGRSIGLFGKEIKGGFDPDSKAEKKDNAKDKKA